MQEEEEENKQETWLPNTPAKPIGEKLNVVYDRKRSNMITGCCMDSNNPSKETNEHVELPAISTPLPETKRKRKNDEAESEKKRNKKPRKKMYRPKVIGEGKRRKGKVPATPDIVKEKSVISKPKTPSPVIPNRPSSKSRTRKLNNAVSRKKSRKKEDKEDNAALEVVNGLGISCRRDLNFDEDDEKFRNERNSSVATVNYQLHSDTQIPKGESEICSNPIEIEATKPKDTPTYNGESEICSNPIEIEASTKHKEDDSVSVTNRIDNQSKSSFRVYERGIKLNGWLRNENFLDLEIPKECKRKRSSRRGKINKFNNLLKGWIPMVEESQSCEGNYNSYEMKLRNNNKLGFRKGQRLGKKSRPKRGRGKGKGLRDILPSFIVRRKRSAMVRRCNFFALCTFPFIEQFESEKDESFSGNANGEACQITYSKLNSSITGNNEEMQTKGLAQMELSPASNWSLNLQSVGTEWKMGGFSHIGDKLSDNTIMDWLDIGRFLTNSKFLNGRSEESSPEEDLYLSGIVTGLHDVDNQGSLMRQQEFTLAARSSGNAIKMNPTLDNLILWNRSQGTENYLEHNRLAGEQRAYDIGSQEEESDPFQEKHLIPYATDCYYQEAQHRLIPNYVSTNCSSGLSHDDTKKEGTDLSKEKQMIPYAREGRKQDMIIPYHRPLNPTKKRHELDKVDLDPRNITMWELLVKSEGNFGKAKVDINTEKWWANEREVFRGRIDAFIARLHPILGDRRFLPWKGSVVDSVVGVFLTQNVSDHLSSSAFMSLAATFPLQSTRNHTENYEAQEILCIQESIERNDGSFECESKLNNSSGLESNKTVDLEAAEDGTASQDFQLLSFEQSTNVTQLLSSTCREEDYRMCAPSYLETTSNTMLHYNKSTFVQGLHSSRSSTLSCESNRENEILESKETDYRSKNPTSERSNQRDTSTTDMLRSYVNCSLCPEWSSQSRSGLEKNHEMYNFCQGTLGVDFRFTPDKESQRLIDGVGKVQSQEIEETRDANRKCCLSSECSNQKMRGIEKTIEFYNFFEEKTEVGPQPLPIDESSDEKLAADIEKVESQESKIQAPDNAKGTKKRGKKGKQKYLEEKSSHNLDDEKKTEIPKGNPKKIKPEIDWDGLQKKWDTMRRVHSSCEPRNSDYMDSVNWQAVRCAEPSKIAEAIKERGQHNIIAGRIKEFLDRVTRVHGSIDLEWLRYAPPDDVKEYLLGIHGLGLKSVECIRLLALQQVAFPVDINVGRIAVRLGWVPLEPLPEEIEMHLLETFPMMDSIQKYLWPRLCTLDQRTLYELHYQLITFGKVFCTKRKPNCNACPLRGECRHYASALARSRLALPGPTEKNTVSSMVPDRALEGAAQMLNPASMLQIEGNPFLGSRCHTNDYAPIIEEPLSPEPEYDESPLPLPDMEDMYNDDSEDMPTIRLNSGRLTTTSQNCMEVANTMLLGGNSIRALVPLNARVASIPMRKLKHINRLRTEHQVYELPDGHPLLFQLERREPSDPSPYLLCISTPGETVNSSELLNTKCLYQESGEVCSEGACSSCNIIREQNSGTVRGTILIPCRTAMRGAFPLNGTYFQVNEVFADDESSKNPIHVPREWIWNLNRRTAYFGTSTTTIFRGLSRDDIQYCFQKGFICVRGFDRKTQTPKRLIERLHKPTTSIAAGKTKANKSEEKIKKQEPDNINLTQ